MPRRKIRSSRHLVGLVSEKLFRMDLYYRLNVFPIAVPPLHDRLEDIPVLVAHFVKRYAERTSKQIDKITSVAMEALVRHPWKHTGAQNFIERAVILTNGDVLQLSALPAGVSVRAGPVSLAEVEPDHILNALRESNWVWAVQAVRRHVWGETDYLDRQQDAKARPVAGEGLWGCLEKTWWEGSKALLHCTAELVLDAQHVSQTTKLLNDHEFRSDPR